jgi:hypothetical protein
MGLGIEWEYREDIISYLIIGYDKKKLETTI